MDLKDCKQSKFIFRIFRFFFRSSDLVWK